MTELETRVTEALEAEALEAPDAVGLADGARQRARRRSRTRTVGLVAAVALAVAAVPVAVGLGGGDDSETPAVVDTATPSPTDGWRTETYRDLELQVPSSWGYGNLSTWCLNGTGVPGDPVVERPGGVTPAIGCGEPENGYGAQFFSTALFDPVEGDLSKAWEYGWEPGQVKVYPRDAWLGVVMAGDYAVRVVAPDQATAQEVLDSVHTVVGADGNGCSVRQDDTGPEVAPGTVAVCRYDAERLLEQSELLTGGDAEAAAAAVQAAPSGSQHGGGPCPATPVEPYGAVLLRETDRDVTVVFGSSCALDNGVSSGAERRRLTADVLYWSLSPGWSGGFSGTVPVPEHFRR